MSNFNKNNGDAIRGVAIRLSSVKKLELREINKVKDKIKSNQVVIDMCEDYGLDTSIIDLIPVGIAKLDVSAKTDHGVIYINEEKFKNGTLDSEDHYLVHELTHVFQQLFGDEPTQGAEDGDYLLNPFEQEGFQNQTAYIADTEGEDVAEDYIDKVLDHHDVNDNKERQYKKNLLLGDK